MVICCSGATPSTSAFLGLSTIDGIGFPSPRMGDFCPLRIVWGFMCNNGRFCVLPRQTPGNLRGHRTISSLLGQLSHMYYTRFQSDFGCSRVPCFEASGNAYQRAVFLLPLGWIETTYTNWHYAGGVFSTLARCLPPSDGTRHEGVATLTLATTVLFHRSKIGRISVWLTLVNWRVAHTWSNSIYLSQHNERWQRHSS